MRRSYHDDKQESILDTRVWKVLECFIMKHDGNGLTANALCYLTEQPWKTVRSVMTRFTGSSQVAGQYCEEVRAPVFFSYSYLLDTKNILLTHSTNLLKQADAIIKKFPPSRWQGATYDKGEKHLTFQMLKYKEDGFVLCDDPEYCAPGLTKQEMKQLLLQQSRELALKLKASWKQNARTRK